MAGRLCLVTILIVSALQTQAAMREQEPTLTAEIGDQKLLLQSERVTRRDEAPPYWTWFIENPRGGATA